jgi:hypothetical protein
MGALGAPGVYVGTAGSDGSRAARIAQALVADADADADADCTVIYRQSPDQREVPREDLGCAALLAAEWPSRGSARRAELAQVAHRRRLGPGSATRPRGLCPDLVYCALRASVSRAAVCGFSGIARPR